MEINAYKIVIDSDYIFCSNTLHSLLLWLCISECYILSFLISGHGLLQGNFCYCRTKLCNLKHTINTVQGFPDVQISSD